MKSRIFDFNEIEDEVESEGEGENSILHRYSPVQW